MKHSCLADFPGTHDSGRHEISIAGHGGLQA